MSEFNIPLNASNYISEERKKAFQEALQDDHTVNMNPHQKSTSMEEKPTGSSSSPPQSPSTTEPEQVPEDSKTPQVLHNLIESIDQGLAHSYAHQNRTLDVHQQYLEQQNEYANVFSEVLEQQRMLLESENGESIKDLLTTLNKNLEGFHAVQEKGAQVHQQFLNQQAAYTEAYVTLLQQQHQTLNGGNGQLPRMDIPQTETKPATHQPPKVGAQVQEPETFSTPDEEHPPAQEKSKKLTPAAVKDEAFLEDQGQKEPQSEDIVPQEEVLSLAELSGTLLEIVGEKTGYPPEMLEMEMDMEADLGIDSIKRVEILGALEDAYPDLPQADTNELAQLRTLQEIVAYMEGLASGNDAIAGPDVSENETDAARSEAPDPETTARENSLSKVDTTGNGKSGLSVEALSGILLDIVGEKTGYPPEMLELDMDMEADLGIDSIKRVEILGAMEDKTDNLPSFETETLAELRTLGEIVEYISQVKEERTAEPMEPTPKKKVLQSNIQVHEVKTTYLPPPDRMELNIPPDRPLLIGDDGTPLAGELASALKKQGWPVVLWTQPDRTGPGKHSAALDLAQYTPESITDRAIARGLDAVRKAQGRIAGFIHIHPPAGTLATGKDREIIKAVFLTAKHLQQDLSHPPDSGRSFFVTVTRYDGKLGTSSEFKFSQGSGLPGLTKTLRWEWPDTFCRAIDLDPDLSPAIGAQAVMKELTDANRHPTEVGYSPQGRVTLAKETISL